MVANTMLKFSGWPVTEEQLEDVAKYSEVLETGSDFLEEDFRKSCEDLVPFPERVEPSECMDAFHQHNYGTIPVLSLIKIYMP